MSSRKIIYKMDKFGQGVEFRLSRLHHNKDLTFAEFTNDMLLAMCVLSGCDYLSSIPGVGPKRAHALIRKFKTFDKVTKHLRYSCVPVPPDYEKLFKKALLTFRHQRVYDPNKEDIVHLTSILDDIDDELDFLGPLMPRHTVKAIAKGELDPITKLPFQGDDPHPAFHTTCPLKNFRPESDKKKLDLPAQKNVLTSYFCFASLEAKGKFRAPRVSPKHSHLANGYLSATRKRVSGEATACKTNGSPDFSNDPVILGDVNYPHNSTEIKFFPELMDDLDSSFHGGSPEQKPLKQSGCPLCKPCLVLRRSHDFEHGSKGVSLTTNQYGQEATVKSSNLQQKMVDNSDPNCKSNRVVNLRSSYFVDKSDDAGSDGKSKKMIVRSSYFKHNKSSKSSRIDEADVELVMDDCSGGGGRDNDHCEELCVKRKVSPTENCEEQVETKHARRETNIEAEGDGLPTDGNKSLDVMVGEKFGCNISHLGHYSDISGKTMDNFVSAISSFKCKSSGSRASRLRAPLRDVKNICPRRTPAASINIGSFAYVPSNGKVARGTGRH